MWSLLNNRVLLPCWNSRVITDSVPRTSACSLVEREVAAAGDAVWDFLRATILRQGRRASSECAYKSFCVVRNARLSRNQCYPADHAGRDDVPSPR